MLPSFFFLGQFLPPPPRLSAGLSWALLIAGLGPGLLGFRVEWVGVLGDRLGFVRLVCAGPLVGIGYASGNRIQTTTDLNF